MIFSSVLLPEPLRPMMPERLAFPQLEAHVVEHLKTLEASRPQQAEHVLAHRIAAHASECGTLSRRRPRSIKRLGHLSDELGRSRREPAKDDDTRQQNDRRVQRQIRVCGRPSVSRPLTSTARENSMIGVGGHR